MTGQNDRQDWSLTGQVRDQAGHCPLTGRYLQPCIYNDHPGELKSWLLNTGSLHIIQPQFIPANIKTVQLMLSGNSIRFQQSC